jgi:hypothetical protein
MRERVNTNKKRNENDVATKIKCVEVSLVAGGVLKG